MLFFKQKAAYEMRISDLISDVCSSYLGTRPRLLKVMRGFSFALVAGIAAALLGAGPVHGGLPDLSPIDAVRLRQHVEVLADDAFQGREAGAPADRKTTNYIAKALANAEIGRAHV